MFTPIIVHILACCPVKKLPIMAREGNAMEHVIRVQTSRENKNIVIY